MNYSIEINNKQKALKIINDTLDLIKENEGRELLTANMPLDDSATLKLFKDGRTIGVFAFEMVKMQRYLRELRPVNFDQIVLLCMLYYSEKREEITCQLPEYVTQDNEAYSLSHHYAYIAYQSAYLKTHHTEAFMVATIKNHISNEEWLSVYMNECKRLGVKIYGL
ncbi:MAG: hypothetical protein SNG27_09385 [Rikenellaceae bacterium]